MSLTGTQPSHPQTTINVVAAEDFYGEVARAVGGKYVHVTAILNDPNVDPHQYEPTPAASIVVQNAQLVIYTGIGYDDWMNNLIQASSGSRDVIDVGGHLLGKRTGDNPHVWYLPQTMPVLATQIAQDLAALDPAHANYFQVRAKAYGNGLQSIQARIARLRQPTSTPVDVSEPVFDYMLRAMNMVPQDPKFSKSIEDGIEPTPTEMAQLEDDITMHRVKFFVENIQTDDPTVKSIVQLAKRNHIPVIAVTETEPKGAHYLQWMMGELQQVQAAIMTH